MSETFSSKTSVDKAKDKLKNDKNFRLVSIRSEAEWLGKTSGYSYISRAGEPRGAVWGHGGSDPNTSSVEYTTVDQLPTDKAAGQNDNQNG